MSGLPIVLGFAAALIAGAFTLGGLFVAHIALAYYGEIPRLPTAALPRVLVDGRRGVLDLD